jgi:hypothetical protein
VDRWKTARILLPVLGFRFLTMLLDVFLGFVAWAGLEDITDSHLKLTRWSWRGLHWAVRIVFALNLFFNDPNRYDFSTPLIFLFR